MCDGNENCLFQIIFPRRPHHDYVDIFLSLSKILKSHWPCELLHDVLVASCVTQHSKKKKKTKNKVTAKMITKFSDRSLYRVSCVTIIELNLTKVENNKERHGKKHHKWDRSIWTFMEVGHRPAKLNASPSSPHTQCTQCGERLISAV